MRCHYILLVSYSNTHTYCNSDQQADCSHRRRDRFSPSRAGSLRQPKTAVRSRARHDPSSEVGRYFGTRSEGRLPLFKAFSHSWRTVPTYQVQWWHAALLRRGVRGGSRRSRRCGMRSRVSKRTRRRRRSSSMRCAGPCIGIRKKLTQFFVWSRCTDTNGILALLEAP